MTDNPTEIQLEPAPEDRRRGRRIAVILGVVAVVAGGVFAALSLSSESNSPEDPVREMFEAAERGDVLGVLEQLDPGERDALREPLIDIVEELNRLEVLKDADLGAVTGIELHVDDLELESERVEDGIARVTITSGKGSYRIEVDKLPLGRFVRDLLGDANDDVNTGADTLESKDSDDFVATVRRGDRWYVSIGYSAAENARGTRPFSQPVLTADGAASPEDAVRRLVEAAAELDVQGMLELLPPDELDAVYRYSGMFVPQLADGARGARESVQVSIPTLELDSDTDGDESLVTIEKIDIEGRSESNTFSIKDGCVHIAGEDFETLDVCPDDRPEDVLRTAPFGFFFGRGAEVEPPKLSFVGKQPRVGFVTTRVDGKWYVSPVRTLLEDLVAVMRIAEPRDLDEIRAYFDRLSASFQGSFESYSCSSDPNAGISYECAYPEEEPGYE